MFSIIVLFVALVTNKKMIGSYSQAEINMKNFVYCFMLVAFLLDILVFLFYILFSLQTTLDFNLDSIFGISLMFLSFIIYIVTNVYSNRYETLKTEMLIIKIAIRFYFWVGVVFLGSSFLYPNLLMIEILDLF
jgi:hypothetical protein